MNEALLQAFGQGKELEWYQMCVRAFVAFLIALPLMRLSGRRSFGMKTPLDNVVAMMLGAILSRGVTGASSFFSTCAACLVLVLIHRAFGWAVIRSKRLARLVRGTPIELYREGRVNEAGMARALVDMEELTENVRLKANLKGLEKVDSAYLETNGEIGIVKKDE